MLMSRNDGCGGKQTSTYLVLDGHACIVSTVLLFPNLVNTHNCKPFPVIQFEESILENSKMNVWLKANLKIMQHYLMVGLRGVENT